MRLPIKHKQLFIWILLIVPAAFGTSLLFSQTTLVINSKNTLSGKINLLPYLYYKNPVNSAFLKADTLIQKLPVNKAHTFQFHIKNTTGALLVKTVRFGNPYVTANNILVTSLQGKEPKHYTGPTNSMHVILAPLEEKVISFNVNELNRADPAKLTVDLVSPEYQEGYRHEVETGQAFFLGLFAFLFIFNLIIYFVTRWKVYLKYAVYIFSALVYFSYYFGFLQQVFPSLNTLSLNLVYTWYSIIFITYFAFLNDFGNYKEYVPRAYLLLNIGIVFKSTETVINTILHFLEVDFIYSAVFVNTILVLEIVLMSFILFYIIKNKNIRGRFVIIASLMLIGGGIIEQAKIFETIDNTYFIEWGITAELLTFSVGLGYITKLHYEEKRAAELLYIKQLIENEKFQKGIAEQLEEQVRQRTHELKTEKQLVEKKNLENELLLAEIHHRVKNNLQVISSLLSLQEKSVDNANVKQAILEGKERIRSMELVHKMLYHGNSYSGIEMNDYVNKLCAGLMESFGLNGEDVRLNASFEPITLSVDTAIPLGLILNELVINSLKHAKSNARALILNIYLREAGSNQLQVSLTDNGDGKISNIEHSNSFGLKIVRALVRQLEGVMEISEDKGLHYSITLKNYGLIA